MVDIDALGVARSLRDIALGLQLTGDSKFRVGAFQRAADAVETLGTRFEELLGTSRLTEVPGIGAGIASQIVEIATTGKSRYLQKIAADLPPGAIELARVPGVSLPTIRKLSEAGVHGLEALRRGLADGSLAAARGFGPKTVARLQTKLELPEPTRAKGALLMDALGEGSHLLDAMRGAGVVDQIEIAGEARRSCEVVSALVLVASTADPHRALDTFARLPRVVLAEPRGGDRIEGRLTSGLAVELTVTPADAYPAALQRLTGSEAHNIALDAVAEAKGLVVGLGGVRHAHDGSRVLVRDERELYARVGATYLPPPLREPDEPLEGPPRGPLLRAADLRGLVHVHTTYSDGRQSIEDMARAAETFGAEYLTITDHSPTAHYANGVEIDRLKRQWDEIASVQERVKIRILRGTESDILRDGSLDYPDEILEQLDVVIASIHNRYALDRAAMTERIVRAMRHPAFKIWGHGLGRILLRRPPVDVDFDAILDAVGTSRAAIELNGDPYRADLAPELAKLARARGIRFVVSVDAHSTRNYEHVTMGVHLAQRAGLEAADVLNTLDADAFVAAVRPFPRGT